MTRNHGETQPPQILHRDRADCADCGLPLVGGGLLCPACGALYHPGCHPKRTGCAVEGCDRTVDVRDWTVVRIDATRRVWTEALVFLVLAWISYQVTWAALRPSLPDLVRRMPDTLSTVS